MTGFLATAGEVLAVTAPPGPFLRLVEEAVGERLAAAAPAAPTVVLDVQGDGRPFDRTGFRPLTRGAYARDGQVLLLDACSSGFDLQRHGAGDPGRRRAGGAGPVPARPAHPGGEPRPARPVPAARRPDAGALPGAVAVGLARPGAAARRRAGRRRGRAAAGRSRRRREDHRAAPRGRRRRRRRRGQPVQRGPGDLLRPGRAAAPGRSRRRARRRHLARSARPGVRIPRARADARTGSWCSSAGRAPR